MAPFTHVSPDRPSRFSAGGHGVLYVGRTFEVALFQTIHHHARFMAATNEPPGWTSQFREIVLDVRAVLHDLRGHADAAAFFASDDRRAPQALGASLRVQGSEGVVHPSVRLPGGECVGLFLPLRDADPTQGWHFDCHWDGVAVDLVGECGSGRVLRVT